MSGVMSILEFVAKTKAIEQDMKGLGPAIVAKACEMVCAESKRVLGEGYPWWPALKPETLAHKMMATPLLETGELRASIEWNSQGLQGYVGSNNDKAIWHELGTSRIPARSFLQGAATRMEKKIYRMAEKAVVAVLMGKGLHSSELGELLHLLKHVAHEVKETAKEIVSDDQNGKRR